jgi:hypothetical protein
MKRFTRMALLLGHRAVLRGGIQRPNMSPSAARSASTRILAKRKAGQVEQAAADLLDWQKFRWSGNY